MANVNIAKQKMRITFLIFIFFLSAQLPAQNDLKTSRFEKHIEFLSDSLPNEISFSNKKNVVISEYIADRFQEAGLYPCGDNDTYFQNYKFLKYRIPTIQGKITFSGMLTIAEGNDKSIYEAHKQFYPLTESADSFLARKFVLKYINFGNEEDFEGVSLNSQAVLVKLEYEQNDSLTLIKNLSDKVKFIESKGAQAIIFCKPYPSFSEKPSAKLEVNLWKSQIPVLYVDTTYDYLKEHNRVHFDYKINSIYVDRINVLAKTTFKKSKFKKPVLITTNYNLGDSSKNYNMSRTAILLELTKDVSNKKFKKHDYIFGFTAESQYFENNSFAELQSINLHIYKVINLENLGNLDEKNPELIYENVLKTLEQLDKKK